MAAVTESNLGKVLAEERAQSKPSELYRLIEHLIARPNKTAHKAAKPPLLIHQVCDRQDRMEGVCRLYHNNPT